MFHTPGSPAGYSPWQVQAQMAHSLRAFLRYSLPTSVFLVAQTLPDRLVICHEVQTLLHPVSFTNLLFLFSVP